MSAINAVEAPARRGVIRADRFALPTPRWAALLAGVATVAVVVAANEPPGGGDYAFFAAAGRRLLSGGALYADPRVQSGVLQPLTLAVLSALPALCAAAVLAGGSWAWLAAMTRFVGRDAGQAPSLARSLGAATLGAAWGLCAATYAVGHPAQLVIVACWVVAAGLARDGRPVVAGLVLAFGAGWETWSVLGAPVLLLAPQRGAWIRGLVTQLAASAAWYVPFMLVGPFRMFGFAWPANHATLVVRLLGVASASWQLRIGQAVFTLAIAGVAAVAARRVGVGVWAVPLAALFGRLATDPVGFAYYWQPVSALLIVMAATFVARSRLVPAVVLVAAAYVDIVVDRVGGDIALVATGIAFAVAWRCLPRGTHAG